VNILNSKIPQNMGNIDHLINLQLLEKVMLLKVLDASNTIRFCVDI
jgi:hypothetical protein